MEVSKGILVDDSRFIYLNNFIEPGLRFISFKIDPLNTHESCFNRKMHHITNI